MRHELTLAVAVGLALLTVPARAEEAPTYKETKQILSARCQVCHSQNPQWMEIEEAPLGVKFDTPEQIKALAPRILQKAIVEKVMPPGNVTEITDKERATIEAWIKAGAKIP